MHFEIIAIKTMCANNVKEYFIILYHSYCSVSFSAQYTMNNTAHLIWVFAIVQFISQELYKS